MEIAEKSVPGIQAGGTQRVMMRQKDVMAFDGHILLRHWSLDSASLESILLLRSEFDRSRSGK